MAYVSSRSQAPLGNTFEEGLLRRPPGRSPEGAKRGFADCGPNWSLGPRGSKETWTEEACCRMAIACQAEGGVPRDWLMWERRAGSVVFCFHCGVRTARG